MNPRIRELVGQAKFMAEETINKKISKNAELDAFAEKFVELIVEDCIKHISDNMEYAKIETADSKERFLEMLRIRVNEIMFEEFRVKK